MAHFAKLGINGKVIAVNVVADADCRNADNQEDETIGQQFLEQTTGWAGAMWVRTSYNTIHNTHLSGDNSKAFRGNFASIGGTYDEEDDIFYPRQPYPSWVKDKTIPDWVAPVTKPNLTSEQLAQNTAGTHAHCYNWDETNQQWNLISIELE